jgi:hypothetical protein
MAIPQIDFLPIPLIDNILEYNFEEHRYVATCEGIRQTAYVNLEVDWGSEENANAYLDLLSKVVYDNIMALVDDSKYKVQLLYYIAHSREMRNVILDIFQDSVWYNRRDGGFMLAYNSGVNLNLGKMIEFGLDKTLSPIAKQKIMNSKLGSRVPFININFINHFDTFVELKDFMLDENYITQEQYDNATKIEELPKSYKYLVYINLDNKYTFEDLRTFEKITKTMKIYNNANGTW